MDGEVNNRTAQIAQDVKRDETRRTQEIDRRRRDATDAGDRQTQEKRRDAGDGQHETDADETQEMWTDAGNVDRHNRRRRIGWTDADETDNTRWTNKTDNTRRT